MVSCADLVCLITQIKEPEFLVLNIDAITHANCVTCVILICKMGTVLLTVSVIR